MGTGAGVSIPFRDRMENWVVQRQAWSWSRGIGWSTCGLAPFWIFDSHDFVEFYSHILCPKFPIFDSLGFESLTRLVTWFFSLSLWEASQPVSIAEV